MPVTYHLNVAPEMQICEVVNSILADMPMLRRTYGKMVYELRPSGTWDKGKAVEWLLDQIKKEYKEQVRVTLMVGFRLVAYFIRSCSHADFTASRACG